MPKKTKKEKLIAEYRRKLSVLSHLSVPNQPTQKITDIVPENDKIAPTSTYTLHQPTPKQPALSTISLDTQNFLLVRKDLMTTLMLIFVMLSIEFIVWRFVG